MKELEEIIQALGVETGDYYIAYTPNNGQYLIKFYNDPNQCEEKLADALNKTGSHAFALWTDSSITLTFFNSDPAAVQSCKDLCAQARQEQAKSFAQKARETNSHSERISNYR